MNKSTIGRKYGWRAERPDHRDFKFIPKLDRDVQPLPVVVDLRPSMPPVYDQGSLGSCTANAIAAAYDYERGKQGLGFITPSRLFVYANERLNECVQLTDDSGAQIRDGVASVAKQGVCPESEWPYDISQFSVVPPQSCYDDALKDQVLQYHAVDLYDIKAALAQAQPVIIGISVFDSFENSQVSQTGVVPMPGPNESCLGGHAVLIVGYDCNKGVYIMRNSWGSGWGQSGYFTLPFAYLEQNGSDFWTLVQVE